MDQADAMSALERLLAKTIPCSASDSHEIFDRSLMLLMLFCFLVYLFALAWEYNFKEDIFSR